MAFDRFEFTKDWTKPEDFPTYEDSEAKVRADLQFQPDEIKAFLNAFLSALEADGLEHIKVRDPETDIEEWVSLKAYLETLNALASSVNDATKEAMTEQAKTFTQAMQLLSNNVNDTVDGLVKNVTVDIDSGAMTVSFQNGNEVTYALPKGGASGAGGHVGPDAPEDENVVIWVDTDEEEDESWPTTAQVREMIEDSAGLQMDLLWENASPTSEFVAQTINIPETDFEFVLAEWKYANTSSDINGGRLFVLARKGYESLMYTNDAAKQFGMTTRVFHVYSDSVVFYDGHNTTTKNNGFAIPIRLYGIK